MNDISEFMTEHFEELWKLSGVSLTALADFIGFTRQTMSNYNRRLCKPSYIVSFILYETFGGIRDALLMDPRTESRGKAIAEILGKIDAEYVRKDFQYALSRVIRSAKGE